MQVSYEDRGRVHELEIAVGHPQASIADLAAALGAPEAGLVVDDRPVPPETGLEESGIVIGSTLRTTVRPQPNHAPAVVTVRVVGGLAAGASFPLAAGTATIGRSDNATVTIEDPAVSRDHCRLDITPTGQVTLTDLGSANGTDVNGERVTEPVTVRRDDIVSLGGGTLLRVLPKDAVGPVVPVDPLREARPGGMIPFNRAPRPVGQNRDDEIVLPDKPDARSGMTFNISMILGPIVMAGAFVMISRDPRYALIAILSPIMMLANVVEELTRGRRSLRRKVREFNAQVERLDEDLSARRAEAVRVLRDGLPDPAEAMARATGPGLRLWERRPGMPDFMELTAGHADLPWSPPVRAGRRDQPASEVAEILDAYATLPCVPVSVDLAPGGVIGLTGDRRAALAVARSLLCQAAATSGPADLTVAVFTDDDRVREWDWAKWLPHVVSRGGGAQVRLLSAGPEMAEALAGDLLAAYARPGDRGSPDQDRRARPVLLVVVDGRSLLEGRPNALRELLSGRDGCPSAGIVLTDRLPAACTITMDVTADGVARLHRLTADEIVEGVVAAGMTEPRARHLARSLARYEDPELHIQGAGLPDKVTLLPLLEMPETSGEAVLARWRDGAASLRAKAVLGVTERDVFTIDLDDDGPHGLIAGTTGSGKSELLRTLVASLAMGNDPQHLTFALIDYKGGGALDECARLPHCVGLVTDLDEQLGARALRCLQAELRHRERLLRGVGLSHVREYQRLRDTERPDLEPMPRLVVVIDEFATLVRSLPDFVDNLVGIAQLGRSLGMHLIMATQRPAGAVNDNIKSNVQLRIALRLESSSDSTDVIDHPVAAHIGSRQLGRAYYRVSAKEVLPFQTALSTGVSEGDAAAPVTVAPFLFRPTSIAGLGAGATEEGETDLQLLVDAAQDAFASLGAPPPRRPWPDPLPGVVPAERLGAKAHRGLRSDTAGLPPLALADDPEGQTQYPVGWDPRDGNLLLYGKVGAGTTSALAALALALARAHAPDELNLYVLDMGAGDLAPLGELPHTGAYIGSTERERQMRLLRMLRAELDRRKAAGGGPWPQWVVLIDNLSSLRGDLDGDMAGMRLLDEFDRVYADGPAVGITIVATGDRAGSVPAPLAAATQQKLVFELADPGEYSYFDLPSKSVPAFVPGRAVIAVTGQVVQLAWNGDDLAAAVSEVVSLRPGAVRTAPPVGLLPTRVEFRSLEAAARTAEEPWFIPVGLSQESLEPIGLQLYEHEHALIAGPPRSGRSTALCTVATALKTSPAPPALVAYAPRKSPLRDCPAVDRVAAEYADLSLLLDPVTHGPLVLLVDDADLVDDKAGTIESFMNARCSGVHVIAAGRADNLRRTFGHWTQTVRDSRCGLLLVPDHDLDGNLLSVDLPNVERTLPTPGRGYLVQEGQHSGIQVAEPVI